MRMNTDAIIRGGAACSSVEALVMSVERRGSVIPLNLMFNQPLRDLAQSEVGVANFQLQGGDIEDSKAN